MTKTETYQLNQWDPEDRILRSDFNADNAAIEAGMKANADAVSAEAAARTAADTAIRTDFAAADTAVRSEFAAADTTIKNSITSEASTRSAQDAAIRKEFAAADATLRSENMMVLLSTTTTTAAATQINVSVSGLNLTSYSKILIIPSIGLSSVADTIRIRINNLTENYYQGSTGTTNAKDYAGVFSAAFGHATKLLNGGAEISLQLDGDCICGWVRGYAPGISYNSVFGISSNTLTPSAISTLNFYATNGNSLVAGSKIRIYGVK